MITLNAIALPRPKSLKREAVYVKTDTTSINGKTGRDTTLLKEKYLLAWEHLSASEAAAILGIVALDRPVAFAVSETNLTVNATQVLTRLNYLRYEIIGGDYFAQAELVLTEA